MLWPAKHPWKGVTALCRAANEGDNSRAVRGRKEGREQRCAPPSPHPPPLPILEGEDKRGSTTADAHVVRGRRQLKSRQGSRGDARAATVTTPCGTHCNSGGLVLQIIFQTVQDSLENAEIFGKNGLQRDDSDAERLARPSTGCGGSAMVDGTLVPTTR